VDSIRKRALAFLLASIAFWGIGCSSKPKYVLQGTLLDHAVVASVDGNLALVKCEEIKDGSSAENKNNHQHYFDIVNGEWLTDCAGCEAFNIRTVEEIEITDDILEYLTPEELTKAVNKNLTIEDVVNIITRIRDDQKENALTLTP
jgi:hypothetical protein